jgi:hypothetical protein
MKIKEIDNKGILIVEKGSGTLAHLLLEKVKEGLFPRENLSEILPLIENLLSRKNSSDPHVTPKDMG